MKAEISNERKEIFKKKKNQKIIVLITQIVTLVGFLALWEWLADAKNY